MSQEKLYTVKETLARLSIGRTSLYWLVRNGKLSAVKIGVKTLFTASELDRFVGSLPAMGGGLN